MIYSINVRQYLHKKRAGNWIYANQPLVSLYLTPYSMIVKYYLRRSRHRGSSSTPKHSTNVIAGYNRLGAFSILYTIL